MAEHVKSDPRFSADEVVKKSMASTLPGFEGLRATDALTTMIRTKLSTNLGMFQPLLPIAIFPTIVMMLTIPNATGKFTQELAEETEVAFEMRWGTSTGKLLTPF